MLGLASSLVKGGASLLTFVKDNLKLYLDFKSSRSDTLAFPSEGSTSFNGSSDKITFTRQVFTGAFTISWWFNGDTEDFYERMFDDSVGSNNILTKDVNGLVTIRINGTYRAQISGVPHNQWCHLAFTRDGSGNIKSYLNGVATGTATDTDEFALDFIGEQCVCSMCNVAMWTRTLSLEEIQSVMNKSYSQLGSVEKTSLVMWQSLDSSSIGQTGNNGVVTPSSGETLGIEKVDNNTASAYGSGSESNIANVTNGVAITYAGVGTGLNAVFSNPSLLNTAIVASENKLHKLTFNAYYEGGSSGSKIRVYDQAVDHVSPTLTTTSASYSLYFYGRHASVTFQQVDMSSGNVVYITDMSFKEVTSNTGVVIGATTTTSVYGGNAPILPRAIDIAESFAEQIGDGSALFNGSSEYIDLGDTFQSLFQSPFSMACWIKLDDGQPSAENNIVGAKGGSNIYFSITTAGKLQLYINRGSEATATSASAIFSNGQEEWHHIAFSVTSSQISFYKNGILDTLDSTNDGDVSSLSFSGWSTDKNLFIGARNNAGTADRFFDGNISGVGLWQGALTQAQVQAHMESTSYQKIPADVKSTLGGELVSSGFYTLSNWVSSNTESNPTATSVKFVRGNDNAGGAIHLKSADNRLTTNLTVGTIYKITLTFTTDDGDAYPVIKDNGNNYYSFGATSGEKVLYYKAVHATGDRIMFQGVSASTFVQIADVSIKEATNDLVAYYPLDADSSANGVTNDVTTGETLGSDLITNGNFDSNTTGWGKSLISTTPSISHSNGKAVVTHSGSDLNVGINTTNNPLNGITGLVKITGYAKITSGSSGTLTINEPYGTNASVDWDGENFTAYMLADGNQDDIAFYVYASSVTIEFDNIVAKEVTSNTGVLK